MRKLSEMPPTWLIEWVAEHRKRMAPLREAMENDGSEWHIRDYDEAFNQEAECLVEMVTSMVDDHLALEKR